MRVTAEFMYLRAGHLGLINTLLLTSQWLLIHQYLSSNLSGCLKGWTLMIPWLLELGTFINDGLQLHSMVLYCIVLYCIVLYRIIIYCIVLYCIVLYCIVLYCIILYGIELYCIVLYYIVLYLLYFIVLNCIVVDMILGL